MPAYYNEIDPYAAAWLRNLIDVGLIAPGDVDERSIADVRASDVAGYTQCHFFAGIGGWSYALRLAGWPDDRPVWTGSCPCQPFSVAGKQEGFADSRHLWPHWRELIAERRPAIVFAEQVANAPQWVRLVRGDLEALGYAVGCLPIEAASAGADHFRDRYWLVADRDFVREQQPQGLGGDEWRWRLNGCSGPSAIALADRHGERSQITLGQSRDVGAERAPAAGNGLCHVADSQSGRCGRRGEREASIHAPSEPEGYEGWTTDELRRWGPAAAVCSIGGCQIIECPDGKWRRLPPPRVRWLGTRLPARISRVRAFGNAIDPRPAAAFIGAYMQVKPT